MKKITLSSILTTALTLPVAVLATISAEEKPSATSIDSLNGLIDQITTVMWVVFGGIAVIMFVTAGIMFLTAQGQPEKVGAARSAFIWGVVGVIVGIIAYSILQIVGTALGV